MFNKATDSIGKLIISTAQGNMDWDYYRNSTTEILTSKYDITDKKYLLIKLRKRRHNGVDDVYSVNFYFNSDNVNNKHITSYFHAENVFECFVYAKYVGYIITNGADSFVSVFSELIDNYMWSVDNGVYITIIERKGKKYKATIEIGISFVNICVFSSYGKRVIYSIRDDSRLYSIVRTEVD